MRKSQKITDKIIAGLFIPLIVLAVVGCFGPMINVTGATRFVDWKYFFDEFPKSVKFDSQVDITTTLCGFSAIGFLATAIIMIVILAIYGLINCISALSGKRDFRALSLTKLMCSASAAYLTMHLLYAANASGQATSLGWGPILVLVASGIALFLSHLRRTILFSIINGKYVAPCLIHFITAGLLFAGAILVAGTQFKINGSLEYGTGLSSYTFTSSLIYTAKEGVAPSNDLIMTVVYLLVSFSLFASSIQLATQFGASGAKKEINYRKGSGKKLASAIILTILVAGAITTLLLHQNHVSYSKFELLPTTIVFMVFVGIALVLTIIESIINKANNLSYNLHEKGIMKSSRPTRVKYSDDELVVAPKTTKQPKPSLEQPVIDDDEVAPIVDEEEEVPIVEE